MRQARSKTKAKTVCRPKLIAVLLLVLFANIGCAGVVSVAGGVTACGEQRLTTRHELFLGLKRPDGQAIEETDFVSFLDAVVTPRFPDGFTVFDATGKYRVADGVLIDEATKVVVLVYPDTEELRERIAEIVASYRARFQQESVGWVRTSACASF